MGSRDRSGDGDKEGANVGELRRGSGMKIEDTGWILDFSGLENCR